MTDKKIKQTQNSIGGYLLEARKRKGWSQLTLSKKLGYTTPQFVSNWENGRSSPPLKALAQCVRILDLEDEKIIEILLDETERALRQQLRKKKTSA